MKDRSPTTQTSYDRLMKVIPPWSVALGLALMKENSVKKKVPEWREQQIHSLVRTVMLYSHDLLDRWTNRRVDSLAQTMRNLVEVCIWIQFCLASESQAREFYEDGTRDARELTEAAIDLNKEINQNREPLDKALTEIKQIADEFGVLNHEAKYKDVRKAAEELGRLPVYKPLYKITSKLAHPTSLMIHLQEHPNAFLDILFGPGETLASAGLTHVETFIRKQFPGVDISY